MFRSHGYDLFIRTIQLLINFRFVKIQTKSIFVVTILIMLKNDIF